MKSTRTAAPLEAPSPRWTAKQVAYFKPLLFLLCLYPCLRWVWLGLTDGLTANPPEFLIRSSGIWSLVGLCLTLTVSPLRRMLAQPAINRCRRMVGLFSFFYAALHVAAWAWWERGGSLSFMWEDFLQRPFIAIGVFATVPMAALALTSTQGWMVRLGARWRVLHQSIYAITLLSLWHFWLIRAGKNDFSEVYAYAAVVAVLLLARWSGRRSS